MHVTRPWPSHQNTLSKFLKHMVSARGLFLEHKGHQENAFFLPASVAKAVYACPIPWWKRTTGKMLVWGAQSRWIARVSAQSITSVQRGRHMQDSSSRVSVGLPWVIHTQRLTRVSLCICGPLLRHHQMAYHWIAGASLIHTPTRIAYVSLPQSECCRPQYCYDLMTSPGFSVEGALLYFHILGSTIPGLLWRQNIFHFQCWGIWMVFNLDVGNLLWECFQGLFSELQRFYSRNGNSNTRRRGLTSAASASGFTTVFFHCEDKLVPYNRLISLLCNVASLLKKTCAGPSGMCKILSM